MSFRLFFVLFFVFSLVVAFASAYDDDFFAERFFLDTDQEEKEASCLREVCVAKGKECMTCWKFLGPSAGTIGGYRQCIGLTDDDKTCRE